MFRKKPIYIVGIVVFTLLLIGDLLIFFLAPAGGGRGQRPDTGDISFNDQMPEDFDPESFDPESFGGQMPGGSFDFEDFEGEMPEGFDSFPGQESGGEGFTVPEGFDSANRPDREEDRAGGGLLTVLRSAFWPVLIVCVLADGLCVFMLIRIGRKKKTEEDPQDCSEEESDSPPRRNRTNTWLAVIAVLLVGGVVLTGLPTGEEGDGLEAQISVQSAQAGVQDIVSRFSGSGTLLNADADTVELPRSVTVTSYAVKNGDRVKAGDVIANVDKTSVQKAIYEVQSLIGEMDGEIAQVKGDTLDDEITARADGRVKAIYVAVGDSVADSMYKNGAVLLISLGGSMTVEVESDQEVSVGQTLTVTLSDKTQVEGKVQQVQDGTVTVTTTDNGPAPDDTVSVATEEGVTLGTGTLRISSPLKVTGYFGTVKRLYVKVGDTVSAGERLLTLENTGDLARYQQLLRERQELTELVSQLSVIYRDGAVKAAADGVVSQIEEDAVYDQVSAASGGSYVLSDLSASAAGSYRIVPLSTEPGPDADPPGEGMTPPAGTQADGTYAGKITKVTYGALYIAISERDMTGSSAASLETMDESLFTVQKQYAPSLTVAVNRYQNGQTVSGSVGELQPGDKVLIRMEGGQVTQIDYIVGAGASVPSQGTVPGGNSMQAPSGGNSMQAPSGGFGGYQQPDTQEEEEEEAVYTVEKASLCAIIPTETMTIQISVDELDILSLAVQQEAAITLDALPGQSFTGTVKKIDPAGTNEGGSTKYTVTMEVPRQEQMLDGMNAAVLIEVGRLDSVLTVPAAAVQEDGNRTYVYTARNKETGEPEKAVDVTTGSTDGTNIEILSGLSQGDTVYYSYAESVTYR